MKIEDQLEALHRLRENPASEETREELRRCLAAKSNLVVAKAARLVGDFELSSFEAALVEAFRRFLVKPAASDKGCAAKTEAAETLYKLGAAEGEVFLTGVRHVQMEPSWGPPVDTAAKLRGVCALGLVRMNHPDATDEIVTLLADREADARIGAVRALAYSGRPEAMALARFKVLMGDSSVDVIGECFAALLALEPQKSVALVGGYLDGRDAAIAEAAAMALGQSRLEEAVAFLKARLDAGAIGDLRRTLLAALALARTESAFACLFSIVEGGSDASAAQAVKALAVYRRDDKIRARLTALVEARNERALTEVLVREFGGG